MTIAGAISLLVTAFGLGAGLGAVAALSRGRG